MIFSNTLVHSINNVFYSHDDVLTNSTLNKDLSFENNNIFNRYLITNINDNEIEIPMIAREHIEQIIFKDMSSLKTVCTQTIVLPLYENSIPSKKRTFDSFIAQFFLYTDYNSRLQKITSSKGEVYYGGTGLIFDDKYNPLLLCTLKVKKILVNNVLRLTYFKPVIYVNPIVFVESNKLINKGIINKIIPYCVDIGVYLPSSPYDIFYKDTIRYSKKKAIVIVDNLDRFFIKPTVPKIQSINEALNECLVDNIDDVLSVI